MASLGQVSIELQVKGEREATQALKRYADASDKLTNSVLGAANKLRSIEGQWEKANKLYREGTLSAKGLQAAQVQLARQMAVLNGITTKNGAIATQTAMAQLRHAQATKQAAQEAERLALQQQRAQQSYDRLRASINPVIAAQQRMRQVHETVRAALAAEIITRDQAAQTLREYRAAVQSVNATNQNAIAGLRGFNTANGAMRQGMSRSSVAIQQTGYQVGDFLVQVQSGTNAFVAFGQQATQLAGLLTLSMNPAMVALGAALSIAIPLTTAIAAGLVRTRDAAGEAASIFDAVATALSNVNTATSSAMLGFDDLTEKFGTSAEQARQFLSVISSIEQMRFQEQFAKAADALRESFDIGDFSSEALAALETAGRAQETILNDLMKRQRELLSEGQNVAAMELGTQINQLRQQFEQAFGAMNTDVTDLAQRLNITTAEAGEFASILATIREAETFEQKGQAALELAEYIRKNVDITQNLTEAEKTAVEQAVKLALQFLEGQKNAALIEDAIDNATSAAGGLNIALGNVTGTLSAAASQAAVLEENIRNAAAAQDQLASAAVSAAAREAGTTAQLEALRNGYSEVESAVKGYVAQRRVELDVENIAAQGQFDKAAELERIISLEAENVRQTEQSTATTKANDKAIRELTSSLEGSGAAGRAAADDIEDAFTGANKVFNDAVITAEEFEVQMANNVVSAVDDVATAWGKFVVSGFQDFKGFVDSVWNSFKNLIAQMIAMAARNRILISLGLASGPTAANAGTMFGGGGGLFGGGGGLFGNILGIGGGGLAGLAGSGGILGGIGSIASGLGGVLSGGGIGSSFANLGGLLSGSVSGLGALGAALPAIGLIIGGISLFIGKTKELDNGLRITVDNMDTLVESFSRVEKSRFFGLMKSRKTSYDEVSEEAASPIQEAVADMQMSIMDAAASIGIGSEAFEDFSYRLKISLKGLSEEAKIEKITEELSKVGDAFAGMALEDTGLIRDGETAMQTLTALSTSLQAVNSTMQFLGRTLFEVSLTGADAARGLVEMMGGLESFQQAQQFFFERFFSPEEQLELLSAQLESAFEGLDLEVPETNEAFRALVEAQDLTTESGRELYAALLQLAPQFDNVVQRSQELNASMVDTGDALEIIGDSIGRKITKSFQDLGVIVPENIGAYDALVGSQKLTTQSGKELHAALLQIVPQFGDFAQILSAMSSGSVADAISGLEEFQSAARELIDFMGGLESFQQQQQFFFENFYSAEEQLESFSKNLSEAFEGLDLEVPETNEAFRALVDAQDLTTESGRELYAALLQLAPQFDNVVQRSQELNGALASTGSAITELTESAKNEIRNLQQQLYDLQGNVEASRAMTLEELQSDEARELQKEIFRLRDAQEKASTATRNSSRASSAATDATDKLNKVTEERESLERKLLELQGDTAALRKLDLAELDSSNRGLQERIWAFEDEQVVLSEREGLERRLLELQGNTAEIRRRELEQLDESNRSLQLAVWRLEDFNKTINELNENDFASLVDFQRAVADQVNQIQDADGLADLSNIGEDLGASLSFGMEDKMDDFMGAIDRLTMAIDNMSIRSQGSSVGSFIGRILSPRFGPRMPMQPYQIPRNTEASRDPVLTNEIRALRQEVAGMRAENNQLQSDGNKYTKRTYDIYRKWDVDGIPPERT